MLLLFLTIGNLGLISAVLLVAATLRVRRWYRPVDSDVSAARPPLTVLVPIRRAGPGLEGRLVRLLEVTRKGDQLVFALEDAGDPAHAVCDALVRSYPGRDVAIVLSGPPGDRTGKHHNLAAALVHARHDLVAVMDDDVEADGAVLDEGARLAGATGAGAAFALPHYGGDGPAGGSLVAAFTNYSFSLHLGALALRGAPRFVVGALWVVRRGALDAIGGFEPFTGAVGDDTAIGRALHAAGYRNRPMRRPARIAHEPLGPTSGARDVLRRLSLLRAESPRLFLAVALTWHPVTLGALALLVAAAAPAVPLGAGAVVFGAAVLARTASVLLLDRRVYRSLPRGRYLVAALLYELVAAPPLLALAAATRRIVWRGRMHGVRTGGTVAAQRDPSVE